MRLKQVEPGKIYTKEKVKFIPRTQSEFNILFGHGYGWEYPFGLFVQIPIIKDPNNLLKDK